MAQFIRDFEENARLLRSQIGPEALKKIIVEMGLFDTLHADDIEALGKRNYLLSLLYDMGMVQDHLIDNLIDKWLEIDYTVKEDELNG